jgi:hypothetical protein
VTCFTISAVSSGYGSLSNAGYSLKAKMIRQFILFAVVASVPWSACLAEKLVDPDKVAPEYREAAVKRRAEQLKVQECTHRVDGARVLPRDRTAHIQQCLDEQ